MGFADYGYGFAPLAPQFGGEQDFLASPKIGGFRGLDQNQMIAHSFLDSATPYYASIDHQVLWGILQQFVADLAVLDLIRQYLRRFVSYGGNYVDITQGISLGCPLSPLMGALYLKPLDDRMAELGCFYVRFMDDIMSGSLVIKNFIPSNLTPLLLPSAFCLLPCFCA
ncbi:reverse transcriptase domain-containing protein [Moorena sp. SIO4G3]|uniref:reverse transcriptase domain-containing protein n=1 Tax=Moorena sp. SIO4G3 TaxID=2607821 RepID=UPI00142CBE4E|nr:reverse transcriptase domain-containing protein [Moorena sp. SIO4G3]NEO79425.1 hypothetical protein [Moorena sp. SIO4G3]